MEHLEKERSRIIAELGEATVELSHLTARISILTEKLREFDRIHSECSQKNRTPVTNFVEAQLKIQVPARSPLVGFTTWKKFEDTYDLGEKLGEGSFSVVKRGTHKGTKKKFAIKVVTREKLSYDDEVLLLDEISILRELEHDHIIRLYEVFKEQKFYFLVTELLEGGELFDRIVLKEAYNEMEARNVCKVLLEALAYCHQKCIAHRDLKPENLLLMSTCNDTDVKIADFGFAKMVTSDSSLKTQCGTPGYVAPEILEGVPYGTKVDMWSLGVIIYILLGGYPPFVDSNQAELFKKIRRGKYEFHDKYWGTVSQGAKDLISSLLTVVPQQRLSAVDALKKDWVNESDQILEVKTLGKSLQELKKFNAKRNFKAGVHALMFVKKLNLLAEDSELKDSVE